MLLLTRSEENSGYKTQIPTLSYPSITFPLRVQSNRFGRLRDEGGDIELWNACVKRLSTQRGAFRAYDDTYGIDWAGIIHRDRSYIEVMLPKMITECLSYDDRVRTVRIESIEYPKIDSVHVMIVINENTRGEVWYG